MKRRIFVRGVGVFWLGLSALAIPEGVPAQPAPQTQAQSRQAEDPLQIAIAKSNAYVELMNRTLRAVDSWGRYTSWVNLRTGPTGRERYIAYGLYTPYDVRSEIEKARQTVGKPPATPELDDTVTRYIEAYEKLAPLLTRASAYYERQDYRDDRMAEGKTLHAQLVPAAEAFLKEREAIERQMRVFSADISQRELAAIEQREGRSARWHVRDVMIEARRILDRMPTEKQPVVDVKAFDEALAVYAASVRRFDEFAQANPGKVRFIDSQPRSLLSKLREYRDKLARARGNGRRAGDTTWILFDYNNMTQLSETAGRF